MAAVPESTRPMSAAEPLMPAGRLIGAYLTEAKYEFLGVMRNAAFAVGFLILPLAMYLLFGVAMSPDDMALDPSFADVQFCAFAVLAVIGPAMFGIGCSLAHEREVGLMRLRRVLPAPAGASIVAKMAMALVFAAVAFAALLVVGLLLGNVTLSAARLAGVAVVMILGSLPFCAVGLYIGAHASAGAAPTMINLLYLPMVWLGGLFIPLPEFMQVQSPIWPVFHLKELALSVAGTAGSPVGHPSLSVAVLVAMTVVFGGLAIRRLARKG